jgi:hypothetical protein
MAQESSIKSRGPIGAHPVTSATISILVIAAIFFTLYVPLYARATPKVGDFPFFYFYLVIYMPVVGIVLWIVITLQKRLAPSRGAPGGPGRCPTRRGQRRRGRGDQVSEPKGAGADWTDERGTSEEGRRRLKGRPEASGRTL